MLKEQYINEFAIFYKRVMRVEKTLKDLIISKYTEIHQDKAYSILYKNYFSKLKGKTVNDNRFIDINLNSKSNKNKLELSVNKLYISETLNLFNHKAYLKDRVRKVFFDIPVKTNKDDFKNKSKILKNFRNTLCHFDIKDFCINKTSYIKTLLYFEKLLNFRYKYTLGSIASINHKISVKTILELIYNNNPEYFNDDRILVNVFDDIALLAGFRTNNLPQYKSIIRAKFKIQSEHKK